MITRKCDICKKEEKEERTLPSERNIYKVERYVSGRVEKALKFAGIEDACRGCGKMAEDIALKIYDKRMKGIGEEVKSAISLALLKR